MFAQDPVRWNFSAKKTADKTFEIHLTADIENGWHIYAQEQPEEAIAIPTKITVNKNPLLVFSGEPKEEGKKEKQEIKSLDIVQYDYSGRVDFVQTVKLKTNAKTNISGNIGFQVCTDEKCLPPKTVSFNIKLE